jgi:hypothetical protein
MNPLQTLHILHFDDVPAPLIEGFVNDCKKVSIDPIVESKPSSPYNALEDYIPTAIALFIAKPFLEAFLKKAGEDSYSVLKTALKSLLKKASQVKVHIFASAPGKFDPNYPFSRYISIYSKTPQGVTLKFIFLTSREEKYYDAATEKLFEMIQNESVPQGDFRPLGNIQILYFDETTLEWKCKNRSGKI